MIVYNLTAVFMNVQTFMHKIVNTTQYH